MKNNKKNTGKNICVITLGCFKNTVDSERLMKQLSVNNFRLVDDASRADTVIINTCGFIRAAKEEAVDTILDAVRLKEHGDIKKIIVFGCLAQRYRAELFKDIPEVDAYFGVESYREIIENLGGEIKKDNLLERKIPDSNHSAFLKISEGCSNRCSYCSIPNIRGPYRSRRMSGLLKETELLAQNNIKELIIIGQDTTNYGVDIYGKRKLDELLEKISRISGIEWIRLMYAHPAHFELKIINSIKSNPKMCRYIDIPLQHISDNILKSMNRKITSKQIRELINRIRKDIPDIILRTTFMVGYPGETEDDFQKLCRFVKEIQFDRLGVFTYSAEEGTKSYKYKDTVSEKVKKERQALIMDIQREISYKKNRKLLGSVMKVIIEGYEGSETGGFYIGRSMGHAPEIDGNILIKTNKKRIKTGGFYDVSIYDCNEYDLFGNME
ncbi:MAG: 30S ribosomal protein S12 methylthiotransferase RimO [Elusimicrobiota bacterium]